MMPLATVARHSAPLDGYKKDRGTGGTLWVQGAEMETSTSDPVSDPVERAFEEWRTGIFAWTLIVVVFGIPTNSLLLHAYHKHPELLSPTHLLILNQGITDLLSCLVVPFYAYMNYTASGIRVMSDEKLVCLVGLFSIMLTMWSSVFNLLLLSIDRLTTIQFPYHYARLVNEPRVKVVIFMLWTSMVTLLMIPMFGLNTWRPNGQCIASSVLPEAYFMNVFLFLTFLVLILVALINLAICGIVIRKRRVLPSGAEPPEPGQKSQYKLTKMLLIVVGVFYLCWLPYVLTSATPLLLTTVPSWLPMLVECAKAPVVVNGAVNPLIFAWKNAALRKVFKKTLGIMGNEENSQITA
jgi:hypothetical protein